jgi:hypothetical protein
MSYENRRGVLIAFDPSIVANAVYVLRSAGINAYYSLKYSCCFALLIIIFQKILN